MRGPPRHVNERCPASAAWGLRTGPSSKGPKLWRLSPIWNHQLSVPNAAVPLALPVGSSVTPRTETAA